MTKSEEIYIKSQLAYLRGKVEVYESYLYSKGILKKPEIKSLNTIRGEE